MPKAAQSISLPLWLSVCPHCIPQGLHTALHFLLGLGDKTHAMLNICATNLGEIISIWW